MELTGVAAVLALAGIPVSVVVSRWQMRTALLQAEATHRTAIEVSEASHKSALEAAEASHRHAIELMERQSEQERLRWRNELRRAEYRTFLTSLGTFHNAYLAPQISDLELRDAYFEVHDGASGVGHVGPKDLENLAIQILYLCRVAYSGDHSQPSEHDPNESLEVRDEKWNAVRILRKEFNTLANETLHGSTGIREHLID